MNASGNLAHPNPEALSVWSRLGNLIDTMLGATTVGLLAIANITGYWAATTTAWIMFFLVTKPLWDLTWWWSPLRLAEQEVNLQTIVSLIVLGLSGLAVWNGASWQRLPRRVSVFLGCAALSVLFSPSSWGVNELLRLFTGAAFFYTAGPFFATPIQFERFAKAFLVVCSVPMVLAFFQLVGALPYTYWDWIDGVKIGRISGGYETPFSLIYLFVFAYPLALYVAYKDGQTLFARQSAWLMLLCMSVVLTFTYHRVGYVAIAAEVFIWLYLSHRRRTALTLLAVSLLVVVLSLSFLKTLYAPVAQSVDSSTEVSSEQFLRGRGIQWFLYMDSYVSSTPFHWIMGLGGSVIQSVLWEDPSDNPLSPNEPHNDYIRILHAYGLVGLSLYLSILALFWRRAQRLLRSRNLFARDLARIVIPVLVGVMVLSVTTEPMRYPTGVWYIFGLGASLFCVRSEAKPFLLKSGA